MKRPMSTGDPCPVCGQGQLALRRSALKTPYHGGTVVISGVEEFHCSACGESFVDHEIMKKIQPAICDQQRKIDGLLTSDEIKAIRKRLKASQSTMGALFGGGAKAFAKYETGRVSQSKALDNELRLIQRDPHNFKRLQQIEKQRRDAIKKHIRKISAAHGTKKRIPARKSLMAS